MSLGIVIAAAGLALRNEDVHAFGQACMILSAAIMWMAARQLEGRTVHAPWVIALPLLFILIELGDYYLDSFDTRLIASCAVMAGLVFATAFEFARGREERLLSRWPAVVLLIATGVGYLAWLPLTVTMPIREAGLMFASTWMPWVIIVATLERSRSWCWRWSRTHGAQAPHRCPD